MKLLRREISDDPRETTGAEVPLRPGTRPLGPAALRQASVFRRFDILPCAGAPAAAYASLLDRLRAYAAQGVTARALVLASPTASAAPGLVMEGLAAQAEQLGLRVVRGELHSPCTRGKASRTGAGAGTPARHGLSVAPRPSALDAEVRAWLGQHREADLVLVEGPPLLHSFDAALVARSCDGLILIAERGVTERRALRDAAGRARISGCPLLGVVVTGAPCPAPRWLGCLLGAGPQPTAF